MPALASAYRPGRPTETVLHSLVREHLETFLAHARETNGAPLPKSVEDEFREYLRCGVFAHGFLPARCEACHHDILVAFSCKKRAVCPSCAGRRMANEAAALVESILPAVPVRQWVLSLKFTLTEEKRDWHNVAPTSLGGSSVILSLAVDDADALGKKLERAGAKVVFPIDDHGYGFRDGRFVDPFGHFWIVSQALE